MLNCVMLVVVCMARVQQHTPANRNTFIKLTGTTKGNRQVVLMLVRPLDIIAAVAGVKSRNIVNHAMGKLLM